MKKIILIICLLVGICFTTHAENEAIPIINTIFHGIDVLLRPAIVTTTVIPQPVTAVEYYPTQPVYVQPTPVYVTPTVVTPVYGPRYITPPRPAYRPGPLPRYHNGPGPHGPHGGNGPGPGGHRR